MIEPGGALLIGLVAGTVSTVGFARIQSYLSKNFNVQVTPSASMDPLPPEVRQQLPESSGT